jgi:hypothetical protein
MGATLSTFSAAMKTKFIGPIRDQLHSNKVLLFGLRDKQDEGSSSLPTGSREFKGIQAMADGIDFVGNEFRIPLRTSRNQGIGSRSENTVLPAPGNEGFQYITEPLRYHYGLFSITGPLLKASESNEGSFKRALSVEMNGTIDSLKRKMNIDAYGDGTGTLTTTTATYGPGVVLPVASTINFQVGEIVDIYDISGSSYIAAARTVTAVDRAGLTVTISGANVSVQAGDRIIRSSSDSTTSVPNNDDAQVINGLQNIIDSTGVLHGIDGSTATYWRSTEIAAGGAQVGDTLLRQLTDGIGFESGDDEEIVLVTTRGVRNYYANSLTSLKRFNDASATTLRGGFKALMFDDNKPMVIDDQCRVGHVFAINTDAMFWSQNSDWEWMDMDGETLKWEPRYDRYVGILFKYANLGTWARNRHGKITGAKDDVR